MPPLRTLFALRQFATFANVDLAELAVIADNVREVRFASGDQVAAADARLKSLHLVLDGRIEARDGASIRTWRSRDVFGLLEVLADRAVTTPVISVEETRTFELTASDTHEILEDNFGVLHAVLRGLASRLATMTPRAPSTPNPASKAGLTLVERVIVLRQYAPFAGGRLQALAAFAQSCEELAWPAGTSVVRANQIADGFVIVLDGMLRQARVGRDAQFLRAGEAIGALEALAGARYGADVDTTTAVRALRCPSAALLDVLEDHTDLGVSMVTNFARLLLDAPREVVRVEHDLQPHVS